MEIENKVHILTLELNIELDILTLTQCNEHACSPVCLHLKASSSPCNTEHEIELVCLTYQIQEQAL